ncbi:MAG TPA: hypothetical protein VLH16_02110 [Bacteroidales bacterium]|nr:hypothetical protein [Bacteroidales bacterium]
MALKYYKKDKPITAQEGDFPAPIVITVPDLLPLGGYNVTFCIFDSGGRAFVKKQSSANQIAVAGQIIQIDFAKADTLGRAGSHRWELQLDKPLEEEITIGGGSFTITPTLIK